MIAAAANFKIRKITISLQRNYRFWRNLVQWCIWTLQTPTANKILWIRWIQDGGNGHLKIRKIAIYPQQDDRFWRHLAHWWVCAFQTNFTNLKMQDGGVRHFEKLKNLSIFVTKWPILPKFDILMSLDPLDPVSQIFGDFKNERWWRRPFGKLKNCNISALQIDQFWENLAWWCVSFLPTASAYKILCF